MFITMKSWYPVMAVVENMKYRLTCHPQILPILVLSSVQPMASSSPQLTNQVLTLYVPQSMLYLKLRIGSRIFYIRLVKLNVQPAEFSRAIQRNLRRIFKTSREQRICSKT